MLNNMCVRCARLGIDCQGTENQVWTGCARKENFQQALKRTLEELEILEKVANQADDEMVADPENAEKEATFDAAYKAEWDKFEEIIKLIVTMTSGKIEDKIAREMVRTKRNEILNFIA